MLFYKYYRKRHVELDFLRGLGTIMVLSSHFPAVTWFKYLWTGLDMFFVLSGYLISDILLKELDKRKSISFKRFFIRRGLKIYPSYYVFIFLGVGITWLFSKNGYIINYIPLDFKQLLIESIYIQNFTYGLWRHTWSLAVEEQFYIFLPILIIFLIRFKHITHKLLWIFIGLWAIAVATRFLNLAYGNPNVLDNKVFEFYSKLDPLLLGVIITCIKRIYLDKLKSIGNNVWIWILIGCVAFNVYWVVALHTAQDLQVRILYTFLSLSYFLVILSLVILRSKKANLIDLMERNWIVRMLGSIGLYSYNIYLWHIMIFEGLFAFAHYRYGLNIAMPERVDYYLIYMVASISFGYILSKLFEIPILKWRDRKFSTLPQKSDTGR